MSIGAGIYPGTPDHAAAVLADILARLQARPGA